MKYAFLLLILFLFTLPALSQQDSTSSGREVALKVFLDCGYCDTDYVRSNISYVNYVRDRKVAQVHILTTSQSTGSGGREYTFNFIGQLEFEGQDDSISTVTRADATSDERREMRVRSLKMGLMRYVAQTPMADYISINYENEVDNAEAEEVVDKWDYWVFQLSGRGWMNGQELYQSRSMNGSLSANRITEKWKFENWASYNYNESTYTLDSATTIFNSNERIFTEVSAVGGINDHWSAGGVVYAQKTPTVISISKLEFSQLLNTTSSSIQILPPSRFVSDIELALSTCNMLIQHSLTKLTNSFSITAFLFLRSLFRNGAPFPCQHQLLNTSTILP